jgi:hypothetical protein
MLVHIPKSKFVLIILMLYESIKFLQNRWADIFCNNLDQNCTQRLRTNRHCTENSHVAEHWFHAFVGSVKNDAFSSYFLCLSSHILPHAHSNLKIFILCIRLQSLRPYSKSSLTLNEWRFNLSFSWMSVLFLNSWRVSSHIVRYDTNPPAIQKQQWHSRKAQIEPPLIECEWAFRIVSVSLRDRSLHMAGVALFFS